MAPSGLNKTEPSVIVPPVAYRSKALMAASLGAGVATALTAAPPCTGGAEAESLVVRCLLEDTAVTVAHRAVEASPGSLACSRNRDLIY